MFRRSPRYGAAQPGEALPRRLALLLILALVVSACESPPPPPGPAAHGYAQAWEKRAYAEMYALLTPEAKERIGLEAFVGRYERIAEEMTLEAMVVAAVEPATAQDERGKPIEGRAVAKLTARYRTTRVGEFAREVSLPLVRQADR